MVDLIRELGATLVIVAENWWHRVPAFGPFWSRPISRNHPSFSRPFLDPKEEEDSQVCDLKVTTFKVGVGEPEPELFSYPVQKPYITIEYRLGKCAAYKANLWMSNHHTANDPSTMSQVSPTFVQMLLIFNGSWPLGKRLNPSLWSDLHSNAAGLPY